MILTQCAVCATELGLTLGKKCGRCSTRYCGAECQVQHWKEGGHDTLCKKIKKAGGAEQYNANKKYAEAVSVAAEACAEDTKGRFASLHAGLALEDEGGSRAGCACRDGGHAHVSCLAEQAKILVEALENNLDKMNERWLRWCVCSLCSRSIRVVRRARLGVLENGVGSRRRTSFGLVTCLVPVLPGGTGRVVRGRGESVHAGRLGASERNTLAMQGNLACTYARLGRDDEALRLWRTHTLDI